MQRRLVIILGPTAVGKTDFSIGKAIEYGSPVISCDSRQIYKDMTIGTAVPDASQLAAVKHYFIQTVPLTETYTADTVLSQVCMRTSADPEAIVLSNSILRCT